MQQWDHLADLWYKKDDQFKKPKGAVSCKIYSGDLSLGSSPETQVFGTVWARVFKEVTREFNYMADCAKLSFNMSVLRDNVDFQWSGFNDSLVTYVSETMQRVSAFRDADCREIFD